MPSPPAPSHPHTASGEVCGICAGDVPPLIGRTLTGTGLTLDQAAHRLIDDGVAPTGLTDVQLRLVEEHAERLAAAG